MKEPSAEAPLQPWRWLQTARAPRSRRAQRQHVLGRAPSHHPQRYCCCTRAGACGCHCHICCRSGKYRGQGKRQPLCIDAGGPVVVGLGYTTGSLHNIREAKTQSFLIHRAEIARDVLQTSSGGACTTRKQVQLRHEYSYEGRNLWPVHLYIISLKHDVHRSQYQQCNMCNTRRTTAHAPFSLSKYGICI